MNTSKMQLFKVHENKIGKEAEKIQEFDEKKVQNFYENNLEKLFNATYIATEYAFEGGRIDTFAIDEDNRPVIIEYKKSSSSSVLLQALFYKNYIQNHWEKAYKTILDKKGKDIADEINWQNIRIILVAQEFDKWTIASTSFLEGVELYKFSFFNQDFFAQEYLNTNKIKTEIQKTKYKNEESIPLVGEANYEKDEWVISKRSGEKYETNLRRFNNANDFVRKIYEEIKEYIYEQYDLVDFIYTKDYWFFKSKKKFIEFIFRKNFLGIQLYTNINETQILEGEDKTKSNFGTLDYLFKIKNENEIEEIKRLIDISFKISNEI